MIKIIIYFSFVLICNLLIKKLNFLPNFNGHKHQLFMSNQNVPLTGGFYILILLFIVFLQNINLLFFFICIFLIGFAGDKNYLISPTKRLILQILTVTLFVHHFELFITTSRIEIFDIFLNNFYFKYVFSVFCILILINGSNFIDGLNGLLLSYFVIVIFIFYKTGLFDAFNLNQNELFFFFTSLILLVLLNYLNIFFLGDSGSYLIGLFVSYLLITAYNLNQYIVTPYFIILLLWYPCFENLFSIIRKNKIGFSPIEADNKHLHQLIFSYLKKKFKINEKYLNPLASTFINIFNLLIIYSASFQPNYTMYQILHLVFAIVMYLTLYLFLSKN
tara:strand:+ start:333 stop:1331 length:999 start_codon:yes stop_codon:yes gene_type:complete